VLVQFGVKALIHTLLWLGDGVSQDYPLNRFNGFPLQTKTVKTVDLSASGS